MEYFIKFSLYLISIFTARFFNKLLYKIDKDFSPLYLLWFIPLLGAGAYICIYIIEICTLKIKLNSNWFTGKNW